MRTLNWYLNKAKELQGIGSDRALNTALGLSHGMVSTYRLSRSYPSPTAMKKIADLANVPEEIALADLGYMSNFDTDAAPVYESLAKMAVKASGFAASLAICGMVYTADISNREYDGTIGEPLAKISQSDFILWEIIDIWC